MGLRLPLQKFLAIQMGVPGEVRGYTDLLLPTILTFLASVSLSYGVANTKFRGGDREGGTSRPPYSDVLHPGELEYVW